MSHLRDIGLKMHKSAIAGLCGRVSKDEVWGLMVRDALLSFDTA